MLRPGCFVILFIRTPQYTPHLLDAACIPVIDSIHGKSLTLSRTPMRTLLPLRTLLLSLAFLFAGTASGIAISTLKDANGKETEWVRDIQRRVTAKAIDSALVYSVAYGTASGRVTKITDAKGQVANFEYFADDTLKRVFYTDVAGNPLSTPEVNFTYDPQRPRLATMTDTTGTTQYGYHPINAADGLPGDGLLATVDGPLAEDTFTYGYDVLGRVVSRSLGGAGTTNVVGYGFNDPLGRLKTIADPLGTFTRAYQGVTGRVDQRAASGRDEDGVCVGAERRSAVDGHSLRR
jgi:YD repeat-containing protein